MAINAKVIKNALKEALAEHNEAGIEALVFPPLKKQSSGASSAVLTQDVIDSLVRYKKHERAKDGTIQTYQKNLGRFARQFPVLPLETETVLSYLEQFNGKTGRYRRNQHDFLNMLYKHATRFFDIANNPLDNLGRPRITRTPIRTLTLKQVGEVDSVVLTTREKAVWELTVGHGWRQVEVRRITAGDVRAVDNGVIWCRGKEREEFTPVLPETLKLLLELSENLKDDETIIRSKIKQRGTTQPLGRSGISQLIQGFLGRSNVKYTGHDLRRTFCTLVREASGDELLAMRLARDKIPGVNDRYINVQPHQLRESLLRHSPVRLISKDPAGESLVETGESRTPRPEETVQNLLQV